MEDLTAFLDRTQLLHFFPTHYKEQIARHLVKMEFPKDKVIFKEGDQSDGLYLIAAGSVGAFISDPELGIEFQVARLGINECFGEMGLLTGEPRSATIRTLEDTVTYQLPSKVFFTLLNGSAQMAVELAKILAKRVAEMSRNQPTTQTADISKFQFNADLYNMLSENLITQYKIIPLALEEGVLTVGSVNIKNTMGYDAVKRIFRGVRLQPLQISEADFNKFMEKARQLLAKPVVSAPQVKKAHTIQYWSEDEKEDRASMTISGEETKRLLDNILAEAIDLEASDIHIEPEYEETVVRFRVEGRLRKRSGPVIPRNVYKSLVSRIKVLSKLDIAEKRLPQDGRFSITIDGRDIDLRVSTLLTKNGEKVVLRILDASTALIELSRVVIADKIYQVVRGLLFQPHGVILVSGPTGSGKTTTMYSMLNERKSKELNIVTVEDPIEYSIPGVTQVQINEAIGLGFSTVLRSILRQDPDVILVGEIRDSETAKMAFEAGLTGKLVISSFHANNSLSALVRLFELGIDPYLASSALLGIINQRLVRRLCPNCPKPFDYPDAVMKSLTLAGAYDPRTPIKLYQPRGCPTCDSTGFKGRMAALELMIFNEATKHLILKKAPPSEIKREAEKGSYISLAKYCNFLLANGLTVPGEVLRVLPREEEMKV
jgi:type IV pilus assembly protein PilB